MHGKISSDIEEVLVPSFFYVLQTITTDAGKQQ